MSKNQLSATAHIPNVQEAKRHGRSGFDIAREVSLTLTFFSHKQPVKSIDV